MIFKTQDETVTSNRDECVVPGSLGRGRLLCGAQTAPGLRMAPLEVTEGSQERPAKPMFQSRQESPRGSGQGRERGTSEADRGAPTEHSTLRQDVPVGFPGKCEPGMRDWT